MSISLNQRANQIVESLVNRSEELRIAISTAECGTRMIDCGVRALGGLEAGKLLAEICLAGLADVAIVPASPLFGGCAVAVRTDQPLAACMASQYAGWQIAVGKFFALGSGPMRAVGSREPLFEEIGFRETGVQPVGVLETEKLPPNDVCESVAQACGVEPHYLTLLCASVHSMAGTVQVVARSVETAIHKLHALGFEIAKIASGYGVAPLPVVASDFLTGIGRTNDAVLYGGDVTLWLHGNDAELAALVPRVPSCASVDFGEPFATIFKKYNHDFYKIDPLLFSPARVTLVNLNSGQRHSAGTLRPDIFNG